MAEYLRSDEIPACIHRVALSRGAPFAFVAPPETPEMGRRRRSAAEHRDETVETLRTLHPGAAVPGSVPETRSAMREGEELILGPRLGRDDDGKRVATVQALVRVGRVDERFTYAPILIKNHEVIEVATTRRVLEGTLAALRPSEAEYVDGVGPRGSISMTRSGLSLGHATRVLETLGHGDERARGAIVDRQGRLWWFELNGEAHPRFNLTTYERLYDERRVVLDAHDAWARGEATFPTAPYWHRDCPECPYAAYCEGQLEMLNDVSLVRFTSFNQQLLLREHGVATRARLARLDPERARQARHRPLNPLEPHEPEAVLGRSIDKLEDLIYRARAHERGTSLRLLAPDAMGCPTADVEVDVDMESYEDVTYLWGASVSVSEPIDGVVAGYHAFVEWGELTGESEAANFQTFWRWMDDLRARCASEGRTFAAYCFWAQAEDGAMNRAVDPPIDGGPTASDLEAFRHSTPRQWIDLHELAKHQLQTEGPLGLKQLAVAAGFRWRDANPSGEASILWYEEATGPDVATAAAARTRLVEYNEDDCRATKALRDWLNGPARSLAHRDDLL